MWTSFLQKWSESLIIGTPKRAQANFMVILLPGDIIFDIWYKFRRNRRFAINTLTCQPKWGQKTGQFAPPPPPMHPLLGKEGVIALHRLSNRKMIWTKIFEWTRLLVADLSSAREKGELPRFPKWLDKFSKYFLAEPPFTLTVEPKFLPERSFIVIQTRKDSYMVRLTQEANLLEKTGSKDIKCLNETA